MPEDISSKSYRNKILFITCLSSSLVPFMGSSLNLALPQIAREFGMNGIEQSWVLTAYLLLTAILQVPFGRLADIWGKRNIFITGLCLFVITSFCCGFAHSSSALIMLRALQGIGSAMVFSTNIAIISSVFPPKERGMAMGINAATVYVSIAAGPSLGGVITQNLGWEYIFFITAGLSAIALTSSFIMMKEQWVEAKGERHLVAKLADLWRSDYGRNIQFSAPKAAQSVKGFSDPDFFPGQGPLIVKVLQGTAAAVSEMGTKGLDFEL